MRQLLAAQDHHTAGIHRTAARLDRRVAVDGRGRGRQSMQAMCAGSMESACTTTAATARWRSSQTRAKCFEKGERDIAKPISSKAFSDSSLDQHTAAARLLSVSLVPRLLAYDTWLTTQCCAYKRLGWPTSLSPCESLPPTTPAQRPHSARHSGSTSSDPRFIEFASAPSTRTPPPGPRGRRVSSLRHRTSPRRLGPRSPRAKLRKQPILHSTLTSATSAQPRPHPTDEPSRPQSTLIHELANKFKPSRGCPRTSNVLSLPGYIPLHRHGERLRGWGRQRARMHDLHGRIRGWRRNGQARVPLQIPPQMHPRLVGHQGARQLSCACLQ